MGLLFLFGFPPPNNDVDLVEMIYVLLLLQASLAHNHITCLLLEQPEECSMFHKGRPK